MYFDTADFLFVENHKNTFLKLWYVTNIFTGTADFVNSLDFYGLKWYYNITQSKEARLAVIFMIRWAVFFERRSAGSAEKAFR